MAARNAGPGARLTPAGQGAWRVEGPLTLSTVGALRTEGRRLLAAASGGLTLELSQVPQVDSAGLALLIDWLAAARSLGRRLQLQHPPESLLSLARLSEVEALIRQSGESGDGSGAERARP